MINTSFNPLSNIQINTLAIEDEKQPLPILDLSQNQDSAVPDQIPLISATSSTFFSIDRIRGFLTQLGLNEDIWNSYFLEDALIQQLLLAFEKESNPSFVQLEAFSSLLSLLRSSTDYNSREFAKTLKIFNKNKSLSVVTEIHIGLLANARILLPRTLGEIFGKKEASNFTQSASLSAKTESICIQYMTKYTNQIISEFDAMQENLKIIIPKVKKLFKKGTFENDEKINEFFQLINIFKKRWKTVREILSHPLLLSKDKEILDFGGELNSFIQSTTIYTNFLKNQSNQLIEYLLKAKEGFQHTNNFNTVLNNMTQSVSMMNNQVKLLQALMSINVKMMQSFVNTKDLQDLELLKFINELTRKMTIREPFTLDNEEWLLLNKLIEKNPDLEKTLSSMNQNSSKHSDMIIKTIGVDPESILKELDGKIAVLYLWQSNLAHFFSSLIGKYTKLNHLYIEEKQTNCQGKPLWLFMSDELIEEETRIKNSKIRPQNVSKTSIFDCNETTSSEEDSENLSIPDLKFIEMELPLFLENISLTNRRFDKEIKINLHKLVPQGSALKAAKASQELRDHMHYATLNIMMFAEAILNRDFYALGTIVPSLFLDLHIQTEQWMKHDLIVATGDYPKTHSLSKLCNLTKLSLEQREFINQFDYGMIQARYPVASLEYYQNNSNVLHWIHFSLNCARAVSLKKEIDLGEINKLISFVFDSYRHAQSFLHKAVSFDLSDFTERLDLCKIEIQESLSSEKGLINWKMAKVNDKSSKIISAKRNELSNAIEDAGDYREPLQEALDHLLRVDIACHLKENYKNPQLAPLHQRNALIMHWVLEQLLVVQGIKQGLGDFRWVQKHDLCLFYSLLKGDPKGFNDLKPFNFGRTIHYSRDKQKENSLPIIVNLLASLKFSKSNMINKKSDVYWNNILNKGIGLLQLLND